MVGSTAQIPTKPSYPEIFRQQNPPLQVSFCEWETTTSPAKNYSFHS